MNGRPMANTNIKMVEIETRKELVQKTNVKGEATFDLTFGDTWQIQIKEIKDYYMWQVEMPKKGNHKSTRKIVYNMEKYERSLRPPVDREALGLEEITQKISPREKPDAENVLFRVRLKRRNGRPLVKFPVQMTNYEQKKIYQAITNAHGEAKFKLPKGKEYEIDLEGINEYTYVRIPNKSGYNGVRSLTFEPINFTEEVINDTIVQKIDHIENGTSGRHFLTVIFREIGSSTPYANKAVTITAMEDGTCYRAITNDQGEAKFMLPKGKHYIHRQIIPNFFGDLYNESLVKDLTRAFGVGKSRKTIKIQPIPNIPDIPKGFNILMTNEEFDFSNFFASEGVKVSGFKNLSTPYYARNHLLFTDEENLVDIDKGFLITNGSFLNAFGPNDSQGKSQWNANYHATNLPKAMNNVQFQSYDPCYLVMNVVPEKSKLELSYVFASEEYPEYPTFDDAFGVFINGEGFDPEKNQALIANTDRTVSIVQMLEGEDLFINNSDSTKKSFLNWQYDGFSPKYTRVFDVTPGETYTIMLVITDSRDGIYDSGAFVGFKSFDE